MPGAEDAARVLRNLLDGWKAGIDAHEPGRVAALFTDDAIFQGLRPYSVGPAGVFEYYDSQPTGMTVTYRLLEARPLGEQAALGYVAADFSYPDRPTVHLAVGVVGVRASKGWRFAHYQAGPVAG